jgi:dihydrofolate reductase
MPAIHAFLATSIDGFVAGPNDSLDWLPSFADVEDTFTPFMTGIGAILMGRRTYDIVAGFEGPWPYGDVPVLVATTRPLSPRTPTVRAVAGPIAEIIATAKATAGERDVYIDGAHLFRSALAAGLVNTLTVTTVPVILGDGIPLFATGARHHAQLESSRPAGAGCIQSRYRLY